MTRKSTFFALTLSSISRVAVLAEKLQRGLGCMHEVKRPSSMRYTLGPRRSMRLPSTITPGETKPSAFWKVPRLVSSCMSSFSPESRSSPRMNTTLPSATSRRAVLPSGFFIS